MGKQLVKLNFDFWKRELDAATQVEVAHIEEEEKTSAEREYEEAKAFHKGLWSMWSHIPVPTPQRRRPWASVPAESTAPAAVRAIRSRRIARIKLADSAPDFDVLAKHALQSPSASESDKAWARNWLRIRTAS